MLSADLIYMARNRARLTQAELGRRLGLPQSQISRWERGQVEPSLETLRRLVRACGLELTLGLANGDDSYVGDIEKSLELEPDKRVEQALRRAEFIREVQGNPTSFDPFTIIEVLSSHEVSYVVVGALAAVIQGYPLPALTMEISPERELPNLGRLARALGNLGVPVDERMLEQQPSWTLETAEGLLELVFEPAATAGYDDLLSDATETMLRGTAVLIASVRDILRMKEATGRELDSATVPALRATLEVIRRREREGR